MTKPPWLKRGKGPSRAFALATFPSKINRINQPRRRERIGIVDCTNGFRAIRTELFVGLPLTERGFAVIVEELYWAKRRAASATPFSSSRDRVRQQRGSASELAGARDILLPLRPIPTPQIVARSRAAV
jgi:hypothetical protein